MPKISRALPKQPPPGAPTRRTSLTAWCAERHLPAIPAVPETVAAFLGSEAARGIKPATIGRRVAAIRYAHKLGGYDDPPTSSEVVKATVQGIRRTMGSAPVRKTPATADKVVAMAALADADMRGLRDRAILLLGFAGAFRRSELVALDASDLEFCNGGMRVHIRRSKTDQEGAGGTIAIVAGSVACPVNARRQPRASRHRRQGRRHRFLGRRGLSA